MKHQFVSFLVVFSMLLAACGNQGVAAGTTPTAQADIPTSTPDPCGVENLEQSIKQVNDLMREFNDSYQLASNVAKEQVPPIISDMQRVRRAAEDQKVPACLQELKTHQLGHMNAVIDIMLAFVSGADLSSLSEGLTKAQNEYNLYTMELASLLGIPTTATARP